MRVLVCGLGYVGSVTAACIWQNAETVFCYDTDDAVMHDLREGRSPIDEPEVEELLAAGRAAGRVLASDGLHEVADADVVLVCVGTHAAEGTLDLGDLRVAARSIGLALRWRPPEAKRLFVVVRSTILPGTMKEVFLPEISSAAGEGPGGRYDVVYNPEFMREGSGVADFKNPSRIVVGGPAAAASPLLEIYSNVEATVFHTSFEVAETIKFADNGFHALKVAFANEIARFAHAVGVSPAEVSQLFLADAKLNLSASYLRPGLGFGGPCLEKDLSALSAEMARKGIAAPVLSHVAQSNDLHGEFLAKEIIKRVPECGRVLLLGLTFKPGSRDLRGSPLIVLAHRLRDEGLDLDIYDPQINSSRLSGRRDDDILGSLRDFMIDDLSADRSWDLAVSGKPIPGVRDAIGDRCPIFEFGGP